MDRVEGIASPEGRAIEEEGNFSANAITVLEARYLLRDEHGVIAETPADMFRRVAQTVAAVETTWGATPSECERLENLFYRAMMRRKFLPNSPTLMNAGRPLGMLSACFVLPLEDSIPDIMETARQIALVQRAGGGTGVDLSRLRPKGSIVRSSGGTTDGPMAFLRMFSGVTDAIQQGAFRRGANMGVLRIDHPDILDFIELKSDLTAVTNYNLSVAVTDEFLEAVRATPEKPHGVINPDTEGQGFLDRQTRSVAYGEDGAAGVKRFLTVREVWEALVRRAHESGEPGLIFIDEINRHNPTPELGPIRGTNPCGEQPLLPSESCVLGSVCLSAFFVEGGERDPADRIDWDGLRETVTLGVRFLDNVVEVNRYPTPEIDRASRQTRKIGLGVMGFADLLFRLGIPYDCDEGIELADRLGALIRDAGWKASERLAETRGPFPAWEQSILHSRQPDRPLENAQVTTIAPTGTISMIGDCSSGIEPVFGLAFRRRVLSGKELLEVNPVFEAALAEKVGDARTISAILEHAITHGSIQDLATVPEGLRATFRTARDIAPEWHVRMQAAWQRHTDGAVSKTINLPAGASVGDVEEAYLLAHKLKCKGITVYRDGARPDQPMALAESSAPQSVPSERSRPLKLPEVIPSVRLRQPTPFGNMHLHISVDPKTGREWEVFAQLGKGGDLANSDLEAICRMVSLFLRSGGDIRMVIDQLEGIGSSLSVPSKDGRIASLGDALARVLRKYLAVKERAGLESLLSGGITSLDPCDRTRGKECGRGQEKLFKIRCPDCNGAGTLAFEEGCLKCHACGYARC